MEEKPHPICEKRWKENLRLILAGSHAGFLEAAVLYPSDVWRTRTKYFEQHPKTRISSIYREEGVLSYWKGFSAYLAIGMSKKVLRFFSFERYWHYFGHNINFEKRPVQANMISGFLSGATESVVMCPLEKVKTLQQLNFDRFGKSPSIYNITKKVIKIEGYRGFYRGVDALVVHHGTFGMIYFTIYHSYVQYLPRPNRTIEFISQAGLAFVASVIPAVLLLPVEIARVKIQGPQPVDEKGNRVVKYRHFYQTFSLLCKERGHKLFFQGLAGRIVRAGASGTILLVVFEYSYLFLRKFNT